jgi:DNA invertase Pin-like site-specific DNA recombinase
VEQPALKRLLEDVEGNKVKTIVVYKIEVYKVARLAGIYRTPTARSWVGAVV